MSRRQSLKKIGFGLFGVAALAFSSVAGAVSAISTSKKLRVCFRGGVHSVQMPNGDWHLWFYQTRETQRKLQKSNYFLRLQAIPISFVYWILFQ